MTPSPPPTVSLAPFIAGAARTAAKHRLALASLGLAVILITGLTYVALGALRINPLHSTMTIHIALAESGGLLANQEVTVRGAPIGHVTAVAVTTAGAQADIDVDARVRIPLDTPVKVSGLSPAGEQFVDFRPVSDAGPYLSDGSTIADTQTRTPVSLTRLLEDSHGVAAQLDNAQLSAIFTELRVGNDGPRKLAALLDGGSFMLSALDAVLPQTVSVLRNGRTVFATLGDVGPGLGGVAKDVSQISRGVMSMDGGFRTLIDRGASQLADVNAVIDDNRVTAVTLLTNLTTVAKATYVRMPALQALFPTDRGSTIDAISSVLHDGGLWALADIYPRYSCDYGMPRRAPSQADFVEPYTYTYCANPDPSVLVRGARNAPRPPGDDTAGPPPGADPRTQTDTTQQTPNTIPTPYGGPELPAAPPR